MEPLSRDQIRTMIVVGFVLAAVANVITFVNSVNSVGFPFTFRAIVDSLVGPLAAVAAVGAWWALTRVEARGGAQLSALRLAYIFFAVEYLLFAIGYNFIFTPIHSFGGFWTTATLWLNFIGALVSAVGLFLMWRTLATSDAEERPA
jgi:hypothetical protein